MPFRKFVEIGRVAYAIGGPENGKLFVIVDVIDYNRVLVDGPCSGVQRQEYRLINLQLTKFKVDIQHGQHSKFVSKAWKKENIDEKWKDSIWAKMVEKKKIRESLSDFDRFKVARLKLQRNKMIKNKFKDMEEHKVNKKKARQMRVNRVQKNVTYRKLNQKLNSMYLKLRKHGVFKAKKDARREAKRAGKPARVRTRSKKSLGSSRKKTDSTKSAKKVVKKTPAKTAAPTALAKPGTTTKPTRKAAIRTGFKHGKPSIRPGAPKPKRLNVKEDKATPKDAKKGAKKDERVAKKDIKKGAKKDTKVGKKDPKAVTKKDSKPAAKKDTKAAAKKDAKKTAAK